MIQIRHGKLLFFSRCEGKKESFNKKFNEKCIKYPMHYNIPKYV